MHVYFVYGDNYRWGKGRSLAQAIKNAQIDLFNHFKFDVFECTDYDDIGVSADGMNYVYEMDGEERKAKYVFNSGAFNGLAENPVDNKLQDALTVSTIFDNLLTVIDEKSADYGIDFYLLKAFTDDTTIVKEAIEDYESKQAQEEEE